MQREVIHDIMFPGSLVVSGLSTSKFPLSGDPIRVDPTLILSPVADIWPLY